MMTSLLTSQLLKLSHVTGLRDNSTKTWQSSMPLQSARSSTATSKRAVIQQRRITQNNLLPCEASKMATTASQDPATFEAPLPVQEGVPPIRALALSKGSPLLCTTASSLSRRPLPRTSLWGLAQLRLTFPWWRQTIRTSHQLRSATRCRRAVPKSHRHRRTEREYTKRLL